MPGSFAQRGETLINPPFYVASTFPLAIRFFSN